MNKTFRHISESQEEFLSSLPQERIQTYIDEYNDFVNFGQEELLRIIEEKQQMISMYKECIQLLGQMKKVVN